MPGLTVSRFDAADYLEDEEDYAGFLQAVVDECDNDPAEVARALGVIARARAVAELALRMGMSRKALTMAFAGEGDPSPESVSKLAAALGFNLGSKSAA